MPSTKYEALSYPTYFLKSRGSIIRNTFLKAELKRLHFLRNEMICMHCSLQKKQNIYLIDIFRASIVIQFIVKVLRLKNRKKNIFESVPFLYLSTFSKCKGVSRASSDRIIYFNKKNGTKSLIRQIMIVNKVPNFLVFPLIICLKFSPLYKPLLIMSMRSTCTPKIEEIPQSQPADKPVAS